MGGIVTMSKLLINDQNKVLVGSNGKAYAISNMDVLKDSTSPVDFTAAAGRILRLVRYGKCEQASTPTPSAPVDIMCNNGTLKVGRESYPIPLGQTVYGGTLDVTTGKLTVDRAMVDLGAKNWYPATAAGHTRFRTSITDIERISSPNIVAPMLCSAYKTETANNTYTGKQGISLQQNEADVYVYDAQRESMTTADFKTAMSGVQLAYKLATPQTYQLTPQTVEMIAERSMFQSNANGNIDITYYANGILKTVSGNPVVITDADGQNAEDVTVHIEPIQSGSGTPSPTNIRPISGMTDINITRLGGVVADGTPEVLTVSADGAATQTVTDIPMLLGVEGFADEVEIISGVKTGKVGVLVIDGTEGWTNYSSGNGIFFLDTDATFGLPSNCLCTHYIGVASTMDASVMPHNSIKCGFGTDVRYNHRVYLRCETDTSLEDVTAFLASQYANGTPVILVYPLATPTTEQLSPQPLNTGAGTNTLTDTAEVSNPEYNLIYKTQ